MTMLGGFTGVTGALLDHRSLDLDSAESVTYRLEQTFRYEYAEPVESMRQRLVIVPPPLHGDQRLNQHSVEVTGAETRHRVQRRAGNTVVRVEADRVEEFVEFRLTAVIERCGAERTGLPVGALNDPRWSRPTRLTTPDAALVTWATQLGRRAASPLGLAERLCSAVHERMTYHFGTTETGTTAAQALAGGVGVCQDYAHVMLALCHHLQLPARYVSGHLLGQGGTHAWVEVLVPDPANPSEALAVPFDPCNDRRAGRGYVTVATGRDYRDVAPTAGTYVGAPTGRLSSTRRLGVIDVL
ncbi:MAG: transglutaminase family protein [Janthinobacterium lividum]